MASNDRDHGYGVNQLYFVVDATVIIPLCRCILHLWKMGRQNATTFLMRALAVIDSCVLLLRMAYSMWSSLWDMLCGDHSCDEKCHLHEYSLHMLEHVTNISIKACTWTSVIIGMNRYIAVCWPLQATRLCTVSNARKQILGVILGSIAYSLPGFFKTKLEKASHN